MSVKRPCKDCMTAGACLAHGCLFKPPGSRAEYEALAAERDAALAQAERLAGALQNLIEDDMGEEADTLRAYQQFKEQGK